MSLKKVNLDKLMREESLISEQEEKARALMLKAREENNGLYVVGRVYDGSS